MMSLKNTLKNEFLKLQNIFENEINGNIFDGEFRGTGEGGGGYGGNPTEPTPELDCAEILEFELIGSVSEGYISTTPEIQSWLDADGNFFISEVVHSTGFVTYGFDVSSYQECEGHGTNSSDDFTNNSQLGAGGGSSGWNGISTFSDCKKYFNSNKNFGESEANRDMITRYCGCEKAFRLSDERIQWLVNEISNGIGTGTSQNRYAACFVCSHYNGEIVTQLDNMKFLCEEVDKNEILKELVGEDCRKNVTWNDIKNKIEDRNWITGNFNINSSNFMQLNMSNNMKNMLEFFNITGYSAFTLNEDDLCSKMNLYNCLKPNFGGLNVGSDLYNIELEKEKVFNIVGNDNVIDRCSGNSIDIIEELEELCNESNITIDNLIDKMSGMDYIIINRETPCEDKTIKELCPKLDNLLRNLIGKGDYVTEPNCELLNNLGASIRTGTFYNLDCDGTRISARADGTKPLGQTSVVRNTNNSIYFNMDVCNKSCFEILSVIIHESLHAEIHRKVLDQLPPPFNDIYPSDQEFKDKMTDLVTNELSGLSNQHDIMAQFYVDEYAKAMWNATGQQGNWTDYRYWAYHGLNVTQAQQAGSTVITQNKYDEYTNQWNNIKDNIQFDCN